MTKRKNSDIETSKKEIKKHGDKKPKKIKSIRIAVMEPNQIDEQREKLEIPVPSMFGTEDLDFSTVMIYQIKEVLPPTKKSSEISWNAGLSMLEGIQPRDELEAALAMQMIGIHNAAMEMIRRSLIMDQSPEGVSENVNRAVKLTRTFALQMEALRKHRNKGNQTIKVEHVSVENGGQALVGNIRTGEG